MQINQRDYFEFQLKEDSGGGASASEDADKLDYLVTMAVEKNTGLVSKYYSRLNNIALNHHGLIGRKHSRGVTV